MSRLQVLIEDKRFDAHGAVLSHLEFAADDGEFIALVGPSGAGKSTLLHILAGLDSRYQGSMLWDGRPMYGKDSNPPRLGMLFQDPRLMPWMSVRDNIELVMKGQHGAAALADALLQEVGLGQWVDAWPGQLSGGMQRRVALARAFAVKPQLMLMDEPFVSLDLPTANRLRESLLALWQRYRPLVLFVTHDLREALAMADRVLFLSAMPSRILLDYRVTERHSRDLDSQDIAGLQNRLLAEHPGLLSGLLGGVEA